MSSCSDPHALAEQAAATLAERTGVAHHDVVVVLGSGWARAADAFGEPVAEQAVTELPGFHAPVAVGHAGLIRSYVVAGLRVICFLGRTHLYEGHGPAAVAHPIRTAAAAGCRVGILTNANGSFVDGWDVGTPVLIRDHLNLTATTPLLGATFVDLTAAWSPRLRALARSLDDRFVEGVYAILPGPHYETRAEALMLRSLGADVVGMSTVLEAIAARERGMELLGISVVTAVELAPSGIDPDEVVAAAERSAATLGPTIARIIDHLPR
jgi:purine-nucleoside phosphorylase